jgi:hypothetical protein
LTRSEGERAMASEMSDLTRRLRPILAPMRRREERQAIKAALAQVSRDYGPGTKPRVRALGAEIHIDKPREREALPERLIRVLVADYGNNRIFDVRVGGDGQVVSSETVNGYQPAFHHDEIREAREIAERDERVANLARMPGSFAGYFLSDLAGDSGRRLVGLHYLATTEDGGAKPLATVVVDLYDNEIVSFSDDGMFGGGAPDRGQPRGGSDGRVR